MELGAHIPQFCSTLEYLKTTKYGLPTPTQLGDRISVDRLQPVAWLSLIFKISAPCISQLKWIFWFRFFFTSCPTSQLCYKKGFSSIGLLQQIWHPYKHATVRSPPSAMFLSNRIHIMPSVFFFSPTVCVISPRGTEILVPVCVIFPVWFIVYLFRLM